LTATEQGSPDNIAYVTEFYHGVLRDLGEYEKAYEIFGLYIQMRDSLNVKEVEKAALRKQMEHDHDKELLALQKEQEKKEAVTRLIIISVSSGLVALAVFLFLLYKRFRTIREQSRIINAHNQRMEKELDFGRTVQMSMMPLTFPAFPKRKEIDIYAALYPAKELGGDFFFIQENKLCFAVGDVSDKGVPSALLMAVTKTLINSKALSIGSTGKMLTEVNNELGEDNESGMFVTLFVGILDTDTGELVYTNAGHNPSYLRRDDGNLERLDTRHGPVVGAMPDLIYKESRLQLHKGDIVLTYTDGVTEAMNADKNLFSKNRLERVLQNGNGQVTLEKLVKSLVSEVKDFEKGADQADDITVLSIQMR